MNQFFLNLPPKPKKPEISHNGSIVMLGSCFVENIEKKLTYCKLPNYTNPFGIIFHPEAIHNLIDRIATQKLFTSDDLFFYNEHWHCFEVHSKWSTTNKVKLLDNLNSTLKNTFEKIKNASHFVLTYGTAWGYFKQDNIVANCHKLPQHQFTKKLCSVNNLETIFKNTFEKITSINPGITVITTVSPVRHIKDGIVENNRSKANLVAALHHVISYTKRTNYYPAYELIVDCLRDYRFYKNDLVHPNQIAIDYIWDHFCETYIYKTETKNLIKKIQEIQRGLLHKPFNVNSIAHQKFISSLEKKKNLLIKTYPFLEF